MPLTEADALYAGAYKAVLERLDPDSCADAERCAAMLNGAQGIRAWARGQSPEVALAYDRAVTDIVKRGQDVLENNVRARQMTAAYEGIPKPP